MGKANGIPSQVTAELCVSVVLKGMNGDFSPAVEMKGRYKEYIYHAFDIIISIIMGKMKQNLYRNPAYFFLSVLHQIDLYKTNAYQGCSLSINTTIETKGYSFLLLEKEEEAFMLKM